MIIPMIIIIKLEYIISSDMLHIIMQLSSLSLLGVPGSCCSTLTTATSTCGIGRQTSSGDDWLVARSNMSLSLPHQVNCQLQGISQF